MTWVLWSGLLDGFPAGLLLRTHTTLAHKAHRTLAPPSFFFRANQGFLHLLVNDPEAAAIVVQVEKEDDGYKFMTHPHIDKKKWNASAALTPKSKSRVFPTAQETSVVKWRRQTSVVVVVVVVVVIDLVWLSGLCFLPTTLCFLTYYIFVFGTPPLFYPFSKHAPTREQG